MLARKHTPRGLWQTLQVMAKVSSPIMFDDLPEEDKKILENKLNGNLVITEGLLRRLTVPPCPDVFLLIERIKMLL